MATPETPENEAAGERIEGAVLRVVHHNPQTRYTVLRVVRPGEVAPQTWVGRSTGIEEGMQVTAAGEWTHHPNYGKQFNFARIAAKAPTTLPGIQRRLERYPGLGAEKAERIVQRFGLDTLAILDKSPRRLLEVEGIGPKTLERIVAHHTARGGPTAEIENQLLELDLPTHFADAISQRFGETALNVLRQHPYRLAREVRGIGFITADKIARALGVDLESDERIEAGLFHTLEQSEQNGHCALPMPILVQNAERLLELPPARIEPAAMALVRSGALVLDQRESDEGEPLPPLCYPPRFYDAERNVAEILTDIALGAGKGRGRWTAVDPPPGLSAGQLAAIAAIRDAGLVILTGGPGTGKSTVTRAIIDTALANESPVLLAAPTGRAAKRLAEATGQRATTIHRLLEIEGGTGEFFHNAQNPLPEGLVVIDEASMLDLPLAEALLLALTPQHRLLLVGDADQLPSVGPGNVLRDVLAAADRADSPIPVVRLTQIFRQAEGSSIVTSAHAILRGKVPESDRSEGGQFYVVQARDSERAHELVLKAITERIPKAYGLDPRTEVQVLCPMHKGKAGTEALNAALQAHHTAGAPELVLPGRPPRVFRVGDRVMQTKNDHERGVFNGDIGLVTAVDPERQILTVEVDGDPVPYDSKQLNALQLAYAVSIHKSQGSEFPAVVVPLLGEHHVMLRRNLLYTAVTRARRLCVLVADPRALTQAVHRSDAARRFTGLRERLLTALRERLGERRTVRHIDGA
ncbi:SF1B family DNA helicase RecD2 [Nannocystis punicea]|uniref:ATP-dependent RecD-like DNA helicase n=1 Tax=Nannocystis punicea TaxID=2995304 RepID=A0ABY7HEQ3_9BACT|nr:ATP-dependent RecD-like DNA helicase [Nannocystis poenicansa]WAS97608.1 ATP-dependent RecD-like DNA helicase [Nannocystis poenicansa]